MVFGASCSKHLLQQDVVQPEVFVNGIASLIRSGKGVGFRQRMALCDIERTHMVKARLSKLNAGSLMGQSLLFRPRLPRRNSSLLGAR